MRLKGFTLEAARTVVERNTASKLLQGKFFADYGIDQLLELPPTHRSPLDHHPAPLEQSSRRGWSGQQLDPPSPPPDRLTITGLRNAFIDGELTPVDVVERIRRRVDDGDFGESLFSPFVCLDFDRAEMAARKSADRYRNGASRGRLDGIPIPIKDQHLMEGLPTTAGTRYLDDIASRDAHLIEVLRNAGAVLYAKTRTTEWGMDPCGFCAHQSMPRNVYSRRHGAGGSSTGSAVAVGAGLAPVATGSDGGGSIRIPAAMTGIFGLKPTYGRIGRSGDLFASSSVSAAGPIGSTTADLVDVLAVAATATDPDDPARRWGPAQRDLARRWRRALGRGVDGCRIGIPQTQWDELDSSLRQRSLAALEQLECDGAELVDLNMPLVDHAPAVGMLSIGLETLANIEDDYRKRPRRFSESLRMMLAILETVDATEYLRAQRTRAALKRSMRDALDSVDLIALPTTATTAADYPPALDKTPLLDEQALRAMTRFTFLANITGLPAATVPVGFDDDLPFGLQFVGGAWDEASVIAVMAHAERQQWTRLRPPPDVRNIVT